MGRGQALPGRRWLAIILGLALGAAVAVGLVAYRQAPTHEAATVNAPTLSVIQVQPLELQLAARGHGVVQAAETWQATARVAGEVVERHPELESGRIIREGTELLVQDPSRYRLSIAEAQAELASLETEVQQLVVEEENTRGLLELEQKRLELAKKELERLQRLAEQDQVASSALDKQRRATLARRQAVAKLENELALIPSRRKRLQAKQEQAQARLDQAREDLADIRFKAPFDLRVSQVAVARHDRASPGQLLFKADSIEAVEVPAHIPLAMLRRVVGSLAGLDAPPGALALQEQVDLQAIDAKVVLAGSGDVRWPARVTRVASGLDPKTRTMRVIVTVARPYDRAQPPERPALQPGMYVRVRLATPSPRPRLVVPATAVHDGAVYMATEGDRLHRQEVAVAFQQNDLAVIEKGLSAGDRVIVDDPAPAVNGMTIEPYRDKALEKALRRRAEGAET